MRPFLFLALLLSLDGDCITDQQHAQDPKWRQILKEEMEDSGWEE